MVTPALHKSQQWFQLNLSLQMHHPQFTEPWYSPRSMWPCSEQFYIFFFLCITCHFYQFLIHALLCNWFTKFVGPYCISVYMALCSAWGFVLTFKISRKAQNDNKRKSTCLTISKWNIHADFLYVISICSKKLYGMQNIV